MTADKYLDLSQFRDGGYLAEVNRRVLHPLGLALALEEDAATGEVRFIGVLDCRDDPEGIRFGSPSAYADKALLIVAEERRRRTAREAALGYWIQPLPDANDT
jgi:hypothetical protein